MIWNAILPGAVLLGLVIFVHELGHFLMAKWRGVRVLRFSMGFGPRLWGFTRGETEYRLNWIPLGGYVQMAGDSPEPGVESTGGPEEFLSHPWYGRLLIAIAGPLANLIAAYLIFVIVCVTGITTWDFPNLLGPTPPSTTAYSIGLREGDRIVRIGGDPVSSMAGIEVRLEKDAGVAPIPIEAQRGAETIRMSLAPDQRKPFLQGLRPPADPPVIGTVVTGMPAYKAGLKEGDRILAVDGRAIGTWNELPAAFSGRVDTPVRLTVQRDSRTLDLSVTPMDPEGKGKTNGRIGIEPPPHSVYIQRFGVVESFGRAAQATVETVASVYGGMWLTISRPLYYREYVGGPLFIMQAASQQARRGLDWFLRFVAMINIAIMAFNLLPLPVLDGGHILLALIEAVRRQAISTRAYLRFQKAGLVVLGTLLVLVLANDPLRIVQRLRAIDQHTPTTERPVGPATP